MTHLCLLLLAAGEVVHLRNGAKLEADSVFDDGASVFVQIRGNTLVFDKSEIAPPPAPATAAIAPTPAPAGPVDRLLDDAARRHGVSRSLVRAVAQVESRGLQNVKSSAGAIGVMQLMPETARALGADPHDQAQNIDAGTRLLRQLLERYQGTPDPLALALAAYNAGAGAVEYFGGVPPYAETRRYVQKVKSQLRRAND